MTELHWHYENLPWNELDPAKTTPDEIRAIKTAALVEYNAPEYTEYLINIFRDDPEFQTLAREWAIEEVQHGKALGLWAERMDPSFSLEAAFARFRAGFKIAHLRDGASVRGSLCGELVARCMVETGTSSYYSAIADATQEPVLRRICRHVAADEFRHYKLFYDYMKGYLRREQVGRWRLLWIGVARVVETEDDELAYAYFAANAPAGATYHHQTCNHAYMRRAYGFYRRKHIERAAAMIIKACGHNPQSWWGRSAGRLMWWIIEGRARRLAASAEPALA